MALTLKEVLNRAQATLENQTGQEDWEVGRFQCVAPLNRASAEHISFLINEKYVDEALQSKAGAILCSADMAAKLKGKAQGLLCVCANPYAAFAKISQYFFAPQHPFEGISPQAFIHPQAQVDPTATIFPFVFMGPGAQVGARTVVYSGCFIGAASTVGQDCILYPNVVIREGCQVGDRCIFNPGAVLGGDGFGFAPTPEENVKIPQIGGVAIADDVEIGANAAIDRGALDNTTIGRQTKIDNLVTVAHGVKIGEFAFVAGQTGIAGSSTIGNRVVLAGQVGVVGHIKIGNNVTIAAQSGVSKNVPDGQVWGGTPAKPHREYAMNLAALNKLSKQSNKG